jgi:hypothetical protein
VVDGLGRSALLAADAFDGSDGLWDVLGTLAGRAPGEPPHPAVLSRCAGALTAVVADLELALEEPRLGELLVVPGRVGVSLTQVDLVAPLDAVHLSVRLRALDADPGWVPAFGRVIRFHFVEGAAR